MAALQEYLALTLDAVRNEPILSGLVVLIIYFFIRTFFLSRRITRLTKGGDGRSLEGTIRALEKRVGELEAHAKKAEAGLENLDARMQTSVRGVATERFDPYGNAGGRQSFATAFLNEEGDGVVVSGIHSRDGVRVYAKEVKDFTSERELSEEEQRSIKQAQQQL